MLAYAASPAGHVQLLQQPASFQSVKAVDEVGEQGVTRQEPGNHSGSPPSQSAGSSSNKVSIMIGGGIGLGPEKGKPEPSLYLSMSLPKRLLHRRRVRGSANFSRTILIFKSFLRRELLELILMAQARTMVELRVLRG
jgi:hypothetical protein